jgi:hypothetical protein
MERLRQYSLYVNLKKCAFAIKQVKFLGFIRSVNGVTMDPARVEAVKNWPTLASIKDI